MSVGDIRALESQASHEVESRETKIEELQQLNDELHRQLKKSQKDADEHKSTINKCLSVVKDLLMEKSRIERKEARLAHKFSWCFRIVIFTLYVFSRSKCMQNRLRLGQFVTKRVGATFQENWTDGYAFQVSISPAPFSFSYS